jgi:phosphoribosyl 1,2-cyclic phosphodiesterase
MKVSVLGSGSKGNSILIIAGDTQLLVDAGFSAKDIERRLRSVGSPPEAISGIVVTHDHGDHTRGVGVFARRFGTPLYMTDATRNACSRLLTGGEEVRTYRPGFSFEVGSVRVDPFLTIHDARDPVAVSLQDLETGFRLGVATDLGRPTAQVRHALEGCDILVLEANHDEGLLHQSPYPAGVKARIASSHGHLSNRAAATLVTELFHPRLACVVLAHLSAECNDPNLAREIVEEALREKGYRGYLGVAPQDEPTSLLDVGALRQRLDPHQLSLI